MFKTRVITALAGAPLLLFFVYLGKYWYGIVLLIIALIGAREFFGLMRQGGWRPVETPEYLFVPLLFFAVYQENLAVIISLWVLFFAAYNIFPVIFFGRIQFWESVFSFWGLVYTGGLASFLFFIRLMPEGFYLTLFLVLVIWAGDVMAYLVGSLVGKKPLAPAISPKKTIEGTAGGLMGCMVVGILLSIYFPVGNLSLLSGALLALFTGVAGVLGDLVQSALKRSVNSKDSGDILPGHGGILDRFDSLLFAAPFFYIYLFFLI